MDRSSDPLATILLVEDEPDLRENYALAMERAGYRVVGAESRAEALQAIEPNMPDVAVIDIGLGRDRDAGFELCRELRQRSEALPILFLTARDDDVDVVSGLRLGADDYLSKTISLAELIARIQTVLRRVDAYARVSRESPVRRVGALDLDLERLRASWRGCTLDLTVTEFHLVACLADQPGQVKSRDALMQAAGVVIDDHTVTAHIKRIRRKFETLDANFDAIVTAYGLGYRWVDTA